MAWILDAEGAAVVCPAVGKKSMAVEQSIPPHDKGLPVYSTYSTIFLMEFGCPLNQIFKGVISLVLWFWRQPVLMQPQPANHAHDRHDAMVMMMIDDAVTMVGAN